jgi:hypothetical protein
MIGNVLTQSLAVVDALHPIAQVAATVNGAAVDMLFFHRIMYILDVGVFGGSGTVDFKLQCSDTSAFTIANNLSGKGITQLLAAGGNNKIVKVGAQAEDLSSSAFALQQRYIRSVLVVGTATSTLYVLALAGIGRWKAEAGVAAAAGVASGKEIAAVTQTISDAT